MVAVADLREAVAAPVTLPHRYGLFSVVSPTVDATREDVGITWNSDVCGGVAVSENTICDPTFTAYDETLWCKELTYAPFSVYVRSSKSTGKGGDIRAQREREVRARLIVGEQSGVERKLRLMLAAADASPQAVSIAGYAGVEKIQAGVAYIEKQITDLYGALGVIHMDRFAAGLADLTVEGGHLRTRLGTPVAAEADAVAEAVPTTTLIYGTGPLVMYQGDVEVFTGFDPAVNSVISLAVRQYVIGWDCFAVGASVTL